MGVFRQWFVAFAACCATIVLEAPDARADGAHDPFIVGGKAPATPAPYVVGIAWEIGMIYCTGTLVSPRILLSAAHCAEDAEKAGTPSVAFFGEDPSKDGIYIPIVSSEMNPAYDPTTLEGDVSVFVLARPAPIPPISVTDGAIDRADVGATLEFFGFGDSVADAPDTTQTGVLLRGTSTFAAFDATTVSYGEVACHGDSGGPVFLDTPVGRRLVGVISHGDSLCQGGGVAVRVDAYRGWIQGRLSALDPPSCMLDDRCAAGCAAIDPDCGSLPLSPGLASVLSTDPPGAGGVAYAGLGTLLLLRMRRRSHRFAVTAAFSSLLASLCGCSSGTSDSGASQQDDAAPSGRIMCQSRPIGDAHSPMELEPVVRQNGAVLRLSPIVEPDRSSNIAVSVQGRNLDGCAVALSAHLVEETAGEQTAGTFVELLASGSTGMPDPLAPDSFVVFNVLSGQRYSLSITVQDATGRSGRTVRTFVAH